MHIKCPYLSRYIQHRTRNRPLPGRRFKSPQTERRGRCARTHREKSWRKREQNYSIHFNYRDWTSDLDARRRGCRTREPDAKWQKQANESSGNAERFPNTVATPNRWVVTAVSKCCPTTVEKGQRCSILFDIIAGLWQREKVVFICDPCEIRWGAFLKNLITVYFLL